MFSVSGLTVEFSSDNSIVDWGILINLTVTHEETNNWKKTPTAFTFQLDADSDDATTLASYAHEDKIDDEARRILGLAANEVVTTALTSALSIACPVCGAAVNAYMCFDDLKGLLNFRREKVNNRKLQTEIGPFLGIDIKIDIPSSSGQDFGLIYRSILQEMVLSGEFNELMNEKL